MPTQLGTDASNPPTNPAAARTPGPPDSTTPAPLAVADLGWEDYFLDPALRTVIAQALAHNRDLRQAALRVAQAQAAWGISRADRGPTVGLDAELTRSRTPADLNLSGRVLQGSAWQVGLGLASWELDFAGRLRSLQDAALDRYLASDDARRATALGLVAQVAQAWLGLCELDERLALARQTRDSRAHTLALTERRVAVGASSRLQAVQLRTLLTQAQALVLQLEQAQAQQQHALALLVGDTPRSWPAPPAPASALASTDWARPLPAGLPAEQLRQRPDLQAAEHQLRAANALIGAARAAFYPRITLTAAGGSASAELDGLFLPGSKAWSFTPRLELPLFDGGRRQANLDLATLRRDEAVAHYEQVVQAAFRDVADALSARDALRAQLAVAQDAVDAQAERARLAQLRVDHGAASLLEVLDAQRDLLAAQQQRLQLKRAWLASQVSLYAALGGGATRLAPADPPAR